MRVRFQLVAAFAAGALGALLVAGVMAVTDGDGDDGSGDTASTVATATARAQAASLSSECLSAADIYDKARPAVVQITSLGQRSQGTGTGVVIDAAGYILTNNHVVDGADSIEVRFADGSTVTAEFIGADEANDLAVVQVDPAEHELAVATLADSDMARVGDQVLAIGNPFSLEGTLTQGIVSAVDRTYSSGGNTRPIREMIQTDAAVNPGNSGGPLLDCRGAVIGINTLLENPTGENVNVGVAFAVAINTAKNSLDEMLAGEAVAHSWLGIAGVDVTAAVAEEAGLTVDSGVYLTLVSSGSPADEAGLRGAFSSESAAANSADIAAGGDVITAVDGEAVASIEQLAGYFDEKKAPGDAVSLTVVRDGNEIVVEARLAEWPA
jgi:S1-C subfamily serine protease